MFCMWMGMYVDVLCGCMIYVCGCMHRCMCTGMCRCMIKACVCMGIWLWCVWTCGFMLCICGWTCEYTWCVCEHVWMCGSECVDVLCIYVCVLPWQVAWWTVTWTMRKENWVVLNLPPFAVWLSEPHCANLEGIGIGGDVLTWELGPPGGNAGTTPLAAHDKKLQDLPSFPSCHPDTATHKSCLYLPAGISTLSLPHPLFSVGTEATSKQACPNHGSHRPPNRLFSEVSLILTQIPAQLAYLQTALFLGAQHKTWFQNSQADPNLPDPPHHGCCLQHLAQPSRLDSLSWDGHPSPCEFLWSQAGMVTAAWGEGISQASSEGQWDHLFIISLLIYAPPSVRALEACSSHCFCNLKDGGGGSRGMAEH